MFFNAFNRDQAKRGDRWTSCLAPVPPFFIFLTHTHTQLVSSWFPFRYNSLILIGKYFKRKTSSQRIHIEHWNWLQTIQINQKSVQNEKLDYNFTRIFLNKINKNTIKLRSYLFISVYRSPSNTPNYSERA